MVGLKFNRLLVVEELEKRYEGNGEKLFRCLCDCGNYTVQRGSFLRHYQNKASGYSRGVKSCGCFFLEMQADLHTTHGMSRADSTSHIEYCTWRNMMLRCYNEKLPHFKYYGGMGIRVVKRWHDPLKWLSDVGPRPDGYDFTLLDKSKHYKPGNAKWTPSNLTCRNTRATKLSFEVAEEIRQLYESGEYMQKDLADMYNTSSTSISEIVSNKKWKPDASD